MKRSFVLILAMVMMLVYGIGEANEALLQNMEFDTDITGWTVGMADPLGTWDLQWSEDYGGSVKMYVSGSPAQIDISKETQIAIMPGDQLTVDVYHTNMGNFSGWFLQVDRFSVFRNQLTSEGHESLTWTADQYYDPGTLITVYSSVWPGSSTTWVESLTYTPVPEPATLLLVGLGGMAIRKVRGKR